LKSENMFMRLITKFRKPPKVSELKNEKDVDGLIWVLNKTSISQTKTKVKAMKALGELRDPRAVDSLIAQLDNEDRSILKESIEALGKIRDARACQSLINLLDIKDQELRKRIITALTRIRCKESIPALVGLLRINDRFLRPKVVDALVFFGSDAVIFLNEALAVKNVSISMGALNVLSRLGQVAIDELVKNLDNPDDDVRWGAAYALGKLHGTSAVDALQKALYDPEITVRIAAVVSLGIIGDEKSEMALAMAVGDENAEVRQAAKGALKGIGATEEDALLLAIKSKDNIVRSQAAWGLSRLSDESSISALLEACKDPYPEVRIAAIQSLGKNGSHLGLETIQSALRDPDEHVRLAAKQVLKQVMMKIIYLTHDLATNNQRRLLETEKMLETFGILTVDPLIEALDNYLELADEERTLVESGFNMAHIRTEEGGRTRALSSLHYQTAEKTADLLQNVTGNYFGMNVKAWRQWWQENKASYFQPNFGEG
jgi:HEAT repeat protein